MFSQKRKHLVLSVTLLSIVLNSGNVNAKTTECLPVNPTIFMDELILDSSTVSTSPLEETTPTPFPAQDQPEVIHPALQNVIAELPEATPEKDNQVTSTPLPRVSEEMVTEISFPKEELSTFLPLHKVVETPITKVEEKLEKLDPMPKPAKNTKADMAKETEKPAKKEEPKKTTTPKPAKVEEEKTTPSPKKEELPAVTAFPPLPKAMNNLPEVIDKDKLDLSATPTPIQVEESEEILLETKKAISEELYSIGYVRVKNSKDKEKFLLKPGEKVQVLQEKKATLQVKAKKGQGFVKKNLLVTSKKAAEQSVKKEVKLFRTTGYCPCYSCSEGYKDHTASGRRAKSSHTVAADTSVLPMYTEVYIEGLGRYTVEDVGGGVKGRHIDVFVRNHDQCDSKNRYNAKVYVIKG